MLRTAVSIIITPGIFISYAAFALAESLFKNINNDYTEPFYSLFILNILLEMTIFVGPKNNLDNSENLLPQKLGLPLFLSIKTELTLDDAR